MVHFSRIPTVAVFVVMYYYHPRRLAKSNIEKQYFSHRVNDVCNGPPPGNDTARQAVGADSIRPQPQIFASTRLCGTASSDTPFTAPLNSISFGRMLCKVQYHTLQIVQSHGLQF